MKIEIRYSRSQGPHVFNLSCGEIKQMKKTKTLSVTQSTRKGSKTIIFSGTEQELSDLGDALRNAC